MSNGNGNAEPESGVEHVVLDTIILTFDRGRDHLEIGGKCNSLDLMLDILARATRVIEKEYRAQGVRELQRKMAEEAQNAAIAAALRKG